MDSWFWEAVLLLCFTIPVIVLFAYAVWDVIRRHDASVFRAVHTVLDAVVIEPKRLAIWSRCEPRAQSRQ